MSNRHNDPVKKAAYNAARREKYHKRKEAGLCVQCGKPMDNDGSKCNACREMERENYKYKQNHGLCPYCGAEIPKTRKLCAVCAEKKAERKRNAREKNPEIAEKEREMQRQLRIKRKEIGLCESCGKRKPIAGKVECARCASRRKRNPPVSVWNMKRTTGICLGKNCEKPAVEGKAYCEYHLQEARKRMEYANTKKKNGNSKLKEIINNDIVAFKGKKGAKKNGVS